jgi:hypothetical protein
MAYRVWRLDGKAQKSPSQLGAFLNVLGYLFFGGCAWEIFGSAGLCLVRFANPRTATTLCLATMSGSSPNFKVITHERIYGFNQ